MNLIDARIEGSRALLAGGGTVALDDYAPLA